MALPQRLLALQVLQVLAGREEKYSLANYANVAVLFATAIVMVVRAAMARRAKANLHIVPLNAQRLGQGRGSPITMQCPSQRAIWVYPEGEVGRLTKMRVSAEK